MKTAWLVLDMATGYIDGWYLQEDYAEKVRERWERATGRNDFVCLGGMVDASKAIPAELHLPTQMCYTGTI